MASNGRDGAWRRVVGRAFGLAALVLVGTAGPEAAADVAEPVLKWERGGCTSWCQTGWYASPAIADLDGDGEPEVVWGSYDLVSLDGATGGLEWRATHANLSGARAGAANTDGVSPSRARTRSPLSSSPTLRSPKGTRGRPTSTSR
jgi:hypothetical protein